MSTLNVNTINPATSGQAVAVNVQNPRSFRNLIINGAMQVAQRGTSSTSDGYKTIDRFKAEGSNTGQTTTQSQQSLSSSDTGPWEKGFRKYYRIALASGGTANVNAWVSIQQRVEAQGIANSGWDYTSASSDITLSFWLRVSTNQTFYSYVYAYDGTPKAYTFSFTASGNNTWTKVTKTIPGNSGITVDDNNGAGLQISLIAFSGTNYTDNRTLNTWAAHDGSNYCPDMATTWITSGTPTFDLTGVQLEVGSVATDFEHRSYYDEHLRCARYYQEQQGGSDVFMYAAKANGTTTADIGVPLVVPMRSSPTVTCSSHRLFQSDAVAYTTSTNAPTVVQWDDAHSIHSAVIALNAGGHSGVANNECCTWSPNSSGLTFESEI